MLNSNDLDRFGRDLSRDYLSKEAPLTSGLAKVAAQHGLNKQQINRIAESANVETYLELLKTSEDKYIDFSLANAASAYSSATEQGKEASMVFDFEDEPKGDIPDSIFSLYETVNTESLAKEAAYSPIKTEAEFRKEAYSIEGTLRFIENNVQETVADFEKSYTQLEYFTKQAVLEGTPFNDIDLILSNAIPGIYEPIQKEIKDKLTKSIPHINLEKDAEARGIPNPDSNFFKIAQQVGNSVEHYGKLKKALAHYKGEYQDLTKEAKLPEFYKEASSVIGGAGKLIKGL
jgi:hypothetical protein